MHNGSGEKGQISKEGTGGISLCFGGIRYRQYYTVFPFQSRFPPSRMD